MHVVLPVCVLTCPGIHMVQLVAPLMAVNDPAMHRMHSVEAALFEYLPSSQSLQVPPETLLFPAEHGLQTPL